MHLMVDRMVKPRMVHQGKEVLVSDDPVQNLCIRCHSPNYAHQAGTDDDRTPVGVHEGLSCGACHEPHSNNAMNSCVKCHPAISNCKLDVLTMDTTFANRASRNNIHFVSCKDCHPEGVR
jgi:c(7)-type cytochrome triheme protein